MTRARSTRAVLAVLAAMVVAPLAGCGGRTDPGPEDPGPGAPGTQPNPVPQAPTETAAGFEVTVQPSLLGESLGYRVQVRNATDGPVRVLRLDSGMLARPEGGSGLVTLVHRHGQGRGGDEAPPTFEAVIVTPGQAVTLESNGRLRVDPRPERVKVCVEVEDVVGRPGGLSTGAGSKIVVTDPGKVVRLACSEPTPVVSG